jgi:hypothetical protein
MQSGERCLTWQVLVLTVFAVNVVSLWREIWGYSVFTYEHIFFEIPLDSEERCSERWVIC